MGTTTCPLHDDQCERITDHETRLRDKRERIIILEQEVANMKESMEGMKEASKAIQQSVDELKAFVLKATVTIGTVGSIGGIAMFIISNWEKIGAMLK